MTITNGYATLADLKTAIGISDTSDDTPLEAAVEAASRLIDPFCGKGRKFWLDSNAVARYYYPCDPHVVWVDDIGSTTDLTVKVDLDGDGTFEQTLSINTHFILTPRNAAAHYPAAAWEGIRLLSASPCLFQGSVTGRPVVEVTAKYGWPAVPRAVERACIMQARAIFKAPDTTFGTFAAGLDGQARTIPRMDPTAAALLESVMRYTEVDDDA